MKPPTPKQEQAKVDRWNEQHPIGTPVVVERDNGDRTETKTRSSAQLLGGHTAVVWCDGISGAYLLDRVYPRTVETEEERPPSMNPTSVAGFGRYPTQDDYRPRHDAEWH